MKKLFLLLAGVFLLTACEEEPNVAPTVEEESQLSAFDRYLMRVAEEGIGMLGDTPTRAGARRVIDPARTRAFVKATTRSEEDTLFYVVNFADSTGFALVDADTTSPTPLIAVTEQGNYSPGEVTNTGFDDYIELLSQNSTREHTLLPIDTTVLGRMYNELVEGPEIIVAPFIEMRWGQGSPYNGFCYNEQTLERTSTGSATTAIAQIMSYYEYPTTLTLTHPYRGDLSAIELNWDEIKDHDFNQWVNGICCNTDHIQLSHLFREIAECAQVCFDPTDPSYGAISLQNILTAFNVLGYDSEGFIDYSWDDIKYSLDHFQPVFCRGNNGQVGASFKSWVIDGYQYQSRIMKTYQEGVGNRLPILLHEEDWSIRKLHINWGEHGINNGYYTAGVFAYRFGDTPIDYSYNLKILINIKPFE